MNKYKNINFISFILQDESTIFFALHLKRNINILFTISFTSVVEKIEIISEIKEFKFKS